MDFLKKYLVPLYQAPDAPSEPEPIDPAVAAVATDVVVEPADPPEDPADPAPQPEHGNKGKPPWFMDRISDLSHRARQAEEERAALRRQLDAANEILARQQRGEGNDTTVPSRAQPEHGTDQFRAEVQREAAIQRLNEDSVSVRNAGVAQFPDFQDSINLLTKLEVTTDPEVLLDLLAADKTHAHIIIDALAKDPERAMAVAKLDSRRRVSEFTRMATAAVAAASQPKVEPKAPPVRGSRAPAPPPQVDPVATKVVDFKSSDGDKMSDEEWSKQWDGEYTTPRSSRRR